MWYLLQEAHKWYIELNVPTSELTSDIVSYTPDEDVVPVTSSVVEDWGSECTQTDYYQLKLSLDHIHMVDTSELYHHAINEIIKVWQPLLIDFF